MMKRSVALLVGLAVVGLVLAGCVSTKDSVIAQHGGDKYQAAKFLKDQGRYQDAVDVFAAFKEDRPQSVLIPLVALHVGECYVALGQYEDAIKSFDEAIAKDPAKVGPFAKDAKAEAQKLLKAQKDADAKAAAEKKAAEDKAAAEAKAAADAKAAAEKKAADEKAAADKAAADAKAKVEADKAKAEADKAAAELKAKETQKATEKK